MHKALSRALWGAFFVGGLTVLGAGAAQASTTSGEDGAASGNQVGMLGELPVTIGGNAISILGDSESSGSTMSAAGGESSAGTNATSGEDAVAGGNQIVPDIVAPIIANGNAISVIGDSSTEGAHTSADTTGNSDGATATTTGEDGIAGGNQVMSDADLPIIIGGNSISVIGDSRTDGEHSSETTTDGSPGGTATTSTGEDGTASGNQVAPDVDAPITISGNDISVIRDDSVLDDGVLGDGLLNGIQDDALVDDSLVSIGIIDDVLLTEPIVDNGLVSGPIVESIISEPVVDGPLLGAGDLNVLSPVEVDSVVGSDSTGTDATADETSTNVTESGLTALMTTAALMPAMMLAATGVEALPLIGGIAVLMATGLGLVFLTRVNGAIG